MSLLNFIAVIITSEDTLTTSAKVERRSNKISQQMQKYVQLVRVYEKQQTCRGKSIRQK